MASQHDIDSYYNKALELVKEAGKVVLEGYSAVKNVETKKVDFDFVTEYDKKVEAILIKELSQAFPSHKFIGEETSEADCELTNEPTWLIDPIDGTTNFVHNNPHFCISVALSIKQELFIGIVYNPVFNQLFTAQKGKGAYLNHSRIHTSTVTKVQDALLGFEASLSRNLSIRDTFLKRIHSIIAISHGIRTLGSCALSLCYVAMGAWDGYTVDTLFCWDYSAGALIIKEAGGVVLSTDGSNFEIMGRKILAAATEELAQDMVELFKKTDKSIST